MNSKDRNLLSTLELNAWNALCREIRVYGADHANSIYARTYWCGVADALDAVGLEYLFGPERLSLRGRGK